MHTHTQISKLSSSTPFLTGVYQQVHMLKMCCTETNHLFHRGPWKLETLTLQKIISALTCRQYRSTSLLAAIDHLDYVTTLIIIIVVQLV